MSNVTWSPENPPLENKSMGKYLRGQSRKFCGVFTSTTITTSSGSYFIDLQSNINLTILVLEVDLYYDDFSTEANAKVFQGKHHFPNLKAFTMAVYVIGMRTWF